MGSGAASCRSVVFRGWREASTKGILKSNSVVAFLSNHSTREPGVCLDEVRIAIGVKKGIIQTIEERMN